MTLTRLTVMTVVLGALQACSGSTDLTCDEVRVYQLAQPGKRVQAPEGLDDLDPLREMPLPDASPREARPLGAECVNRPPKATIGN